MAEASDKETFRAKIQAKIDAEEKKDPYKKFVKNNEQHLKDNLDFIVSYMDANKFFSYKDNSGTLIEGKITKLDNVTTSLNALLDIIQSGNIEQRRADLVNKLPEKVELTKLDFGVTTRALTLRS